MRVKDLKPGDEVTIPAVGSATFVAAAPHPHYHGLALVIWAEVNHAPFPEFEELERSGWSLDALSWEQEIGEVTTEETPADRGQRLWRVFEPIRHGAILDTAVREAKRPREDES